MIMTALVIVLAFISSTVVGASSAPDYEADLIPDSMNPSNGMTADVWTALDNYRAGTNTTLYLEIDGIVVIDNGTLLPGLVWETGANYIRLKNTDGDTTVVISFYDGTYTTPYDILLGDNIIVDSVDTLFTNPSSTIIYIDGYTAPSVINEIFTGVSSIITGFLALMVTLFSDTGVVAVFYNDSSGLTLVGGLLVLIFGYGLVRWAFSYVRRLISLRG